MFPYFCYGCQNERLENTVLAVVLFHKHMLYVSRVYQNMTKLSKRTVCIKESSTYNDIL